MKLTTSSVLAIRASLLRRHTRRPHVRIVPGAWLNQAVLGGRVQRRERGLVLRTLPPAEALRETRAQREREATQYWDSLTPEQEVWAFRKMGFAGIGSPARP